MTVSRRELSNKLELGEEDVIVGAHKAFQQNLAEWQELRT